MKNYQIELKLASLHYSISQMFSNWGDGASLNTRYVTEKCDELILEIFGYPLPFNPLLPSVLDNVHMVWLVNKMHASVTKAFEVYWVDPKSAALLLVTLQKLVKYLEIANNEGVLQ